MKASFLLMVILFAGCSRPNRSAISKPVRYGIIYNKNYWQNTRDFTANGAIISVSSNRIVLTQNAVKSTLDLNYNSLLDHWKASATITNASAGTIAGIGTRSINAYQKFSVYAAIDYSTGRLNIYCTNNETTKRVATSVDSLPIKTKDVVLITIERKVDTIIARAYDQTTGLDSTSTKYAYLTNNYDIPSPNTGTFSVYANKGSFILDSLAITSVEIKNANLLIVTDSKGMYMADKFVSRWPQQIANHVKPTVLSVGGTDGVNELLARTPEIIALSPASVLLAVGRNDLNFKMDFDTLKARYSKAVNLLKLAGIEVYHLNCIYETFLGQNKYSKWISSTYGSNVIDTYKATTKANNILSPDGVHPNQAGNNLIAATIIQSGKLK